MSVDNKQLGTFRLDGIPAAPRGVPQVEVTFDIDANGILHVSAKDLGTGREQKISITGSSGLSEEEVEARRREAEQYADEDKKRRDRVEIRNRAESLAYSAEKQLRDTGDKLPDSVKAPLTEQIEKVKGLLDNGEADVLKSAADELEKRLSAAGEEIYKASAGSGSGAEGSAGPGPEAGSSAKADDVVDAEFEVVDEEKK
jgi:molecular chaperone DnaK